MSNLTINQEKHRDLWLRLEAFQLDDPEASFPFSHRLARDNAWSIKFAKEVIEEYKKFLFLCMTAGHTCTPSDEVDQVWHLHMTYTRSYWGELCPNVLQHDLHHGPTKGGAEQKSWFGDCYAKTKQSYEAAFGSAPPANIWPSAEIRFGHAAALRWVDTKKNLVISKASIRRALVGGATSVTALLLASCKPVESIDGWTTWMTIGILVLAFAMVIYSLTMATMEPSSRRKRRKSGSSGIADDGGGEGFFSNLFDVLGCGGGGDGGGGDGGCGGGGCGGGGCGGCGGCGG